MYPIKAKDDMYGALDKFLKKVSTNGRWLKVLRSDSATEYKSQAYRAVLAKYGNIKLEFSAPYYKSQNGLAERMVGTIMPRALAMLFARGAPAFLWPYAITYAAHVTNLLLCSALPDSKTPWEMWYGTVGPISWLRIFYCEAYVKDEEARKLGPRSKLHRYLGPSSEAK